jgi:hypothetical protein
MSLSQEKRKKIRQERRKVFDAGVTFRWSQGRDITHAEWDFFYRCYERTYLEHGNAPYLNRDFFQRMADTMPDQWLLFTARAKWAIPIATSLIATRCIFLPGETDLNMLQETGRHRVFCAGQGGARNSGRGTRSRSTLPPSNRTTRNRQGGLWPLLGCIGARGLPAF